MDAINQGIEYHQAGRLVEAEAIYRQILHTTPNHPDALHWLGVIAHQMGEDKQALELITHAISISNIKLASYYSHLGMVYKQLKKFGEAIVAFQQAITLNPNHAETYNNAGNVFQAQCQLDEAIASYQNALALKPDLVEAYNNIGDVLKIKGRFDEAATYYQQAKLLVPQSFSAYNAALGLAILYFLKNDLTNSREELDQAKGVFGGISRDSVASQIYCNYLDFLLNWWEQVKNSKQPETLATLYVIGESHSLSLQNVTVSIDGHSYYCQANWIEGVKQWHLANDEKNIYKYQVARILESLPTNATALLTIGEIDCRYNEGIFPFCNKTRKNTQEVINTTVNPYLNYVSNLAKLKNVKLIVCAVPASNATITELSVEDTKSFGLFLQNFNETLKKEVQNRSLMFLDVFNLTNRGDGFTNGEYHLDSHHLRPDAMQIAFLSNLNH